MEPGHESALAAQAVPRTLKARCSGCQATDALLCLDDDGMPVFDEHMTQLLSTTYTPSCGVRLVECPISQHPVRVTLQPL